ncbi:MAG: carbohydrate kinase family protein [Chloroflexi bacterium]|nr:carbohydrate kinase family protein [Chloroflexota bacterium]
MIDVVAAGHLCVDIIPTIPRASAEARTFLAPGRLSEVGPLMFSTGGSVSNTGLALYRLGLDVCLLARVGGDRIGALIRDLLAAQDPRLVEGLTIAPDEASSYTIVINPPGVDRTFLHCPGTNHTFGLEDARPELLRQARLFHLGYPPLMRRLYSEQGEELAAIFELARESGATTSLDMAMPDPAGPSGQVDWRAVLAHVLPQVDLFVPSVEETLFMLRRGRFETLSREAGEGLLDALSAEEIASLAEEALAFGARIVLLKLGHRGLYLRTAPGLAKGRTLGRGGPARLDVWDGRELWAPPFAVEVVGTTGAGDAAIAGFLGGVLRGATPEEAVTWAAAVGACCVEAADATSGVRTWKETQSRVRAGWMRRPIEVAGRGWFWDDNVQLWRGPAEAMS